jgi:hypothetical protein
VKDVVGKVGGFIGKAAPIIRKVGNFMTYRLGNLDKIGQGINKESGVVGSVTDMLPVGGI